MAQRFHPGDDTIFEVLKKEHLSILDFFRRIDMEREPSSREDILSELECEMQLHMALEEDIFYPILLSRREVFLGLLSSSSKGHERIREALQGFLELASDGDLWTRKIQSLKEAFEDHILREEEKLFPLARRILHKGQPLAIGRFFIRERRLQTGV